jgi:hypothetical protein
VKPIARLQVVREGRFRRERSLVKACGRGCEAPVRQKPVRQGQLSRYLRRPFITGEDRGKVGTDGKQCLTEVELPSLFASSSVRRGQTEQALRRRAGVGEATLVKKGRRQSVPRLAGRREQARGLLEGQGRLLGPALRSEYSSETDVEADVLGLQGDPGFKLIDRLPRTRLSRKIKGQ